VVNWRLNWFCLLLMSRWHLCQDKARTKFFLKTVAFSGSGTVIAAENSDSQTILILTPEGLFEASRMMCKG
jgi:hypothetical protein